jgi:Tol biopolymer transport system component
MRRLTELPGLETQPDISPDGRQLVYTSAAAGNLDLYVMRVGGGRAINVTANSPANDEQAAFSPDGEQLVFRSSRDGGGLFLMGATGESVRRLTDEGYDPTWSPDGKSIAYSTEGVFDPDSRNSDAGLWIVDVATGRKHERLAGDAVQPAWSPDGRFLAYWSNTGGVRDLWTVGASGGEPIAVTSDLATDWSPEWSPDGRWLHFSSDRAGGMNLFRVPIDAATGAAAGDPEALTTSVGNLGWARLSADGRRMVAAVYEQSAVLDLYQVAPGADPPLQPLGTLRPRSLRWCRLSPDAEWLLCSTIGSPEDLVVLRSDGSELRRLTDDIFKDRNADWSPDGEQILFQSTRSGRWNLWALRSDGSEPRRLTDFTESSTPVWSADGRRATIMAYGRGIADVDPNQLTTLETLESVALPETLQGFLPGGWSPSGTLLGGTEVDAMLRALSIGAIEPATGSYRRSKLPMSGTGFWTFGGWLGDSRHFIARGAEEIALVDAETGNWRELLPIRAQEQALSFSRDTMTLLVETASADGDIWIFETAEGDG